MKTILKNPIFYLISKTYHYAGNRKKYVILVICMIAISTAIYSAMPLVFARFLDFVQTNGINRDNLPTLLLILSVFFMCEIISWAFWGPARIIEQKTAFEAEKNYKTYLLSGIMSLPMEWQTGHHSGDIIDKIEKGTKAMGYFSETTFEFTNSFVQMAFAFIALVFVDVRISLLAIGMSAFILYVILFYDKKLVPGYTKVNKKENRVSEKIYDSISNIATVIILRAESLIIKAVTETISAIFPDFRKNAINNELKWFWAASLGQLSLVLAMIFYVFSEINSPQGVMVGSLYVIYSYSSRVRETFFSFAHLYNKAVRWKSSIKNSEELTIDFPNIFSEKKHLSKKWQTIEIKDLTFSYNKDEVKNLEGVSVSIKKGEKIAVIGESGGGKTTFLKIIRGLYKPEKMILNIDDRNTKNDFDDISESISLIPQDPEIFATTIRENITFGTIQKDEDLQYFAEMASFAEIAEKLPKKYESNINEKGVNLSGGERQRLALARGLFASKNKEIILLDEPTSSLDFQNELKIYQNIFKNFSDKTILTSVHKLHLLPIFDRIIFFKQGKIIADGILDDLIKNSPEFAELWQKYIEAQNQQV